MEKYTLYNGDCLNELKKLPDNSVDSCVTDPPYGLSSSSPSKLKERIDKTIRKAFNIVLPNFEKGDGYSRSPNQVGQ